MELTAEQQAAIDRYVAAARAEGCPADQIENFLRAGVVLQPRQLAASAAARLCDAPDGPTEVAYGGARAGGKSHWGMAQIGADDCQRFPGLKVLALRKVGKALKEAVGDLLRRVYADLAYEWTPSTQTVTFPNGSRILLGHFQKESDIDGYLGLEYDVILIEEATTLSASKRKAILTCLRSSKPGWRPRAYSTTNPGGIGHAWYRRELVEPHRTATGYRPLMEQTGPTRYVPATVDDNAFVNREYKGQLDALTGWQLRAWRHGDWDIAAGQYFTTFRREAHVQPFPFAELPATWPVWVSMDYGYNHFTSAYLFTAHDGIIYALDEHGERRWLVPQHADAIKAMLARWKVHPARLQSFVAGSDVFAQRHTGRSIAEEYADQRLILTPAVTDRINGWGEILSRLGNADATPPIPARLSIAPLCARLIETLPLLQHDPHRPEDVLKWDVDEDGSGGDDWADAFRYGVMAYRPATSAPAVGGQRARL